ncbi:hypothetical protein J2S00_001978 [Caldalkalibacillus uzonensis]|uniref:Citrate transporter n=1 Tax=Caldalkalibacillus uzonensis TaxID=353224 RepID=A0ABU0CST5_9BACI|nr:hypothetical protein [Caldalkalibacillus uzonensis]MDQ0339192.1 hypothetical protein [Caldalkalibacillus uzonensis]
METVDLSFIHWVFLAGILVVIACMILRRDVVLPSIVGIFLIGILYHGSLVGAIQTIFKAFLLAGEELFSIMLVISLMVAMLLSMRALGADQQMIAPIKRLMLTPWVAFWILGLIMYVAATFFWPTPAIALVGTLLIPIAMKVGLPAIAAAVAVNLFGHGMALSGDLVIQGATSLTAASANVDPADILPYTALFSLVTGVVAVTAAFFILRRDLKKGKIRPGKAPQELEAKVKSSRRPRLAGWMAILVPVILVSIVLTMYMQGIRGGEATALLGGTAAALLILLTVVQAGKDSFEAIVGHLREGLLFAIKIFTPVIPIAGYFFMGSPRYAPEILGEGATGYLFDLGSALAQALPLDAVALSIGIVLVGILTGLDGSGFSGLPLVGSLSAAIGGPAGVDVHVLASLGQIAAIWAGGGTLTAWAFGLAADAGIAGVKPADVVRKNFIPVMLGLGTVTIVAMAILIL